jgi:hypothetical protein
MSARETHLSPHLVPVSQVSLSDPGSIFVVELFSSQLTIKIAARLQNRKLKRLFIYVSSSAMRIILAHTATHILVDIFLK